MTAAAAKTKKRRVDPIPRVKAWTDNSDLILDLARLGWLDKGLRTLDPTYGKHGVWWKKWRPNDLVAYHQPDDGIDFRALPDEDGSYEQVAFDPPYVARGGRKTAGKELAATNDRYGLADTPSTPRALQYDLINPGLSEMWRVAAPGAVVLVKCQDYITSGSLWMGTVETYHWALWCGFKLEDYADLLDTPRPQPHDNQVHLAANSTGLWVFRKPLPPRARRKPKPKGPTLQLVTS